MNRLLLFFALVIAGCATHAGIATLPQETFYLSREGPLYSDAAKLKTDALQEVEQHCRSKGKKTMITLLAEERVQTLFFTYPRVDMKFRCVEG